MSCTVMSCAVLSCTVLSCAMCASRNKRVLLCCLLYEVQTFTTDITALSRHYVDIWYSALSRHYGPPGNLSRTPNLSLRSTSDSECVATPLTTMRWSWHEKGQNACVDESLAQKEANLWIFKVLTFLRIFDDFHAKMMIFARKSSKMSKLWNFISLLPFELETRLNTRFVDIC